MSGAAHRRRALALLLSATLAASAVAADLPRVFLSPAERAALTASRSSGRPLPSASPSSATAATPEARSADPATSSAPVAAPRRVRIDGVTFGAGRQQAAWIGGERIADGGYWSGQRVRVIRDGVQLVARDGSVRRLRVGTEVRP